MPDPSAVTLKVSNYYPGEPNKPATPIGQWIVYPAYGSSISVFNTIVVDLSQNLFIASALDHAKTTPDTPLATGGSNSTDPKGWLFSLGVTQAGTPQLKVNTDIWIFGTSAYRPNVKLAFDAFMQALEQLEGSALVAGGSTPFQQVLASVVPATFAESLYFRHGVYQDSVNKQAYTDLQPGMCLRLDLEASQLVFPTSGQLTQYSSPVNGYVGAGQARTYLVETLDKDGNPRLAFDAYLASSPVPTVSPTSANGAGGIVDLAGGTYRYVRLCYPATIAPSEAPGSVTTVNNATLVCANDLATLAAATAGYYNTGSVATSGAAGYFFRGRTIPVPEITCFVSGAPVAVPVGTTVRQLVQRYAPLPRLAGVTMPSTYSRYLLASPTGAVGGFPGAYLQVGFAAVTGTSPQDAYDLPVLGQDALTLTVPVV